MKRNQVVIAAAALALILLMALPFVIARYRSDHGSLPSPELPAGMKECVLSRADMRTEHMKLLYQWRDQVVREGKRNPIVIGGTQYQKSLAGTCMKCHRNREKFCDRCHVPLSVAPSCWDCHIYTKEPRP